MCLPIVLAKTRKTHDHNEPPRSTQPGHNCVDRRNKYQPPLRVHVHCTFIHTFVMSYCTHNN